MEELIKLLIALMIAVAIIKVWEIFKSTSRGSGLKVPANSKISTGTKNEPLPYVRKKYFLSVAEHEFMKVLEEIIQDKYYIFPQVHISSLLRPSGDRSTRYTYRNKINRKSVDFVILEKNNLKPMLAIELDDRSHNSQRRQKRDHFVNKAFESANLPLLRVRASKNYNKDEIRQKMNEFFVSPNKENEH
ncbi:MAG: DUF2726 domain-containing protein [Candidatus Spechtbacterales bacterium]|nr:DUF2726 domain-containing protein [Candidatus Spechtbacterales bacterium]